MTLTFVSLLFYLMVAAPAAALWLRIMEQPPAAADDEADDEAPHTARARWRRRVWRMVPFVPLWLITVLLLVVVSVLHRPVPPAYGTVVPVYMEVVIGPGRPAVDVRLNLTTSYAGLQTGEVRYGWMCSWVSSGLQG